MQHEGLQTRRKHYRNKLFKEDFLHKTTTVVTISGYYSTAGRSTTGSIIHALMSVIYLINMKTLYYALLCLITLVCQIIQTSLLQCYFWILWLLLNQGIAHCICLVASQPLFHWRAPCAGESPRDPMWCGCPGRWEHCPHPAGQPEPCTCSQGHLLPMHHPAAAQAAAPLLHRMLHVPPYTLFKGLLLSSKVLSCKIHVSLKRCLKGFLFS